MEEIIRRHYRAKEEELREAEEMERFEEEQREEAAKKLREQRAAEVKAKKLLEARAEEVEDKMRVYREKRRKRDKSKTRVWMPTSKPCTSNDRGVTLDNVVARSANAKAQEMILRSSAKELSPQEVKEWNNKYEPIRKENRKRQLTYSEIENCLFRPRTTLSAKEQEDVQEIINKMGKNFANKYPDVYKACMYHKAVKAYKEGNSAKALRKIGKAFNIEAVIKMFHPNYEEFCR
eukprot:TRINITY_DN14343_c0_g1_i12.p2 TRINITY_DN14343_c0_g1~~TRINITY_DN14343_c0_g1_i12.p2  ORF type:complete len:234 (-),score=98.63 TRINITY_DN14343_c0_g1_i12:438-1139(-)